MGRVGIRGGGHQCTSSPWLASAKYVFSFILGWIYGVCHVLRLFHPYCIRMTAFLLPYLQCAGTHFDLNPSPPCRAGPSAPFTGPARAGIRTSSTTALCRLLARNRPSAGATAVWPKHWDSGLEAGARAATSVRRGLRSWWRVVRRQLPTQPVWHPFPLLRAAPLHPPVLASSLMPLLIRTMSFPLPPGCSRVQSLGHWSQRRAGHRSRSSGLHLDLCRQSLHGQQEPPRQRQQEGR